MKIYEFCPFFNENKIAEIKIKENSCWIDELHIVEADKTFSYDDKVFNFNKTLINDKVVYHQLEGKNLFNQLLEHQLYFNVDTCNQNHFDKWYWRLLSHNSTFSNEARQRNLAKDYLFEKVKDDDIIILSDFDEIIDSRNADLIIDSVRKHKIVTVKLHYSVFYLNLFCMSNHGAPHFSYRTYAMLGKFFKTMPFTSDYLRKKGIAEALYNEVHCIKEPVGYHHSWLEFSENALPKLIAFKGNVKNKSDVDKSYLNKCLNDRKLYYLDSELIVDNDKNFLQSIEKFKDDSLWLTD